MPPPPAPSPAPAPEGGGSSSGVALRTARLALLQYGQGRLSRKALLARGGAMGAAKPQLRLQHEGGQQEQEQQQQGEGEEGQKNA